tara:strand:+ start:486 stop:797 length:312 start_codon:yes stop_codon:yes gene_type:complete
MIQVSSLNALLYNIAISGHQYLGENTSAALLGFGPQLHPSAQATIVKFSEKKESVLGAETYILEGKNVVYDKQGCKRMIHWPVQQQARTRKNVKKVSSCVHEE